MVIKGLQNQSFYRQIIHNLCGHHLSSIPLPEFHLFPASIPRGSVNLNCWHNNSIQDRRLISDNKRLQMNSLRYLSHKSHNIHIDYFYFSYIII